MRGETQPIGPPQPTEALRGRDRASGALDTPRLPAATDSAADGESPVLAPLTFLSAARHDQLAYEDETGDGLAVGSLSLALSSALTRAGTETTYRDLFDRVKKFMAAPGAQSAAGGGRPGPSALPG